MRINNSKQNFTNISALARPLGAFYNPNAVAPTLAIEAGVTLGRSYEANKRGGKKEAIERFVEQGTSALIWVYGVQFLQKLNEFFGKKILKNVVPYEGYCEQTATKEQKELAQKIKNFKFDVGFDKNKNPIKDNKINPKIANFKIGSLILATAFATYFIGFILPKINHFISSKITPKKKEENNSQLKQVNFNDFKNQTKKKEISFTSISGLAHILENNSTARLFITDTGVIAGRYKNGRNKYEKIEGLFRDISSIFFYLKSTDLIVKGLNKLTKTVNISPSILKEIKDVDFNSEEFTDNALNIATNGAYKDKLRFVSQKKINGIKKQIEDFDNLIKSNNISNEALGKIINKNIRKNFLNYTIGTVVSMFALGILIPKVQYFITKKLTNKNEFPGSDNYKIEDKK